MIAAVAMALSSVSVVTNSLRLRRFDTLRSVQTNGGVSSVGGALGGGNGLGGNSLSGDGGGGVEGGGGGGGLDEIASVGVTVGVPPLRWTSVAMLSLIRNSADTTSR